MNVHGRRTAVVILCLGWAYASTFSTNALGKEGDQLEQKTSGLSAKVDAWIKEGGNPMKVGPLGDKLDGYIKNGDRANAEKTADAILKIVNVKPVKREGPTLQEKANGLPAKVEAYGKAGGDTTKVSPLAEKLDVYIKEGDAAKAEETIDKILEIVEPKKK